MMIKADDFFRPGDESGIISIRRELHRVPELNMDLPETTAIVVRELEKLLIPYSLEYAPSGIVGYINYGDANPKTAPAAGEEGHVFTVALRADMDALPITENTGLPFSSGHPGKMHACGHDAHTAMLLGAAAALKRAEEKDLLNCRVKLIFQPNEEGPESGAMVMCENGVLSDVDFIFGQHIEQSLKTGEIGWIEGPYMAKCHSYDIDFNGHASHAALPQGGRDALMMAVKAVNDIYVMNSREIDPFANHIISVGQLNAGTAHNIIAEHAHMAVSVRTFDEKLDAFIRDRIFSICKNAAEELGGTIEFREDVSAFVVVNDKKCTDMLLRSARETVGDDKIVRIGMDMGSEDFSCFLRERPGCFSRIGTGNPEKGCTGVPHNSDLIIDEDALITGSRLFAQLVLDI